MDKIQVIYRKNNLLIVLGEKGIELTRAEAEQLFVDLGHALQDQDIVNAHRQREGKDEL